MRLDDSDWLAVAERLAVGTRTRITHTCGSGFPLLVSSDPDRWSAWCFRCNAGGYQSKTHVRYKPVEAPAQTITAGATLPYDLEPWDALELRKGRLTGWLHNKGMHISMLPPNSVQWSESQRRLVFKVNDSLHLGRYIPMYDTDPDMQKWMLYGYRETPCVGSALPPDFGQQSCAPVIVEDILSAFKVHWATGRNCIALLGTKLNADVYLHLEGWEAPLVWLDGDAAGIKGMREAIRELRWNDYKPVPVQTPIDPKEYSGEEIRKIIVKAIGDWT